MTARLFCSGSMVPAYQLRRGSRKAANRSAAGGTARLPWLAKSGKVALLVLARLTPSVTI
jgi:hypothetical protein